ncbi:DUF6580 family putative transport protein [Sediminibacterium sp.]|uniref:DUF6580 family putative transport protein n=1 Tax=Sediminibacterium sp. TaxID=1917865 RepID=UPI003F71CB46
MKLNKQFIFSLVLMVLASAIYRVFPNRPMGFAPQMAIAIFAGSLFFKNKKLAFLLPLLSMFISDGLYQILYMNGLTEISGFYGGQWKNYLLIIGLTSIGFFVKQDKIASVAGASLAAPTIYFILSNGLVWLGGGGLHRPKTFEGLMMTYADGLPFYPNSIYSTLFFSLVLFGTWYLVKRNAARLNLA